MVANNSSATGFASADALSAVSVDKNTGKVSGTQLEIQAVTKHWKPKNRSACILQADRFDSKE